jgi:translocator protein
MNSFDAKKVLLAKVYPALKCSSRLTASLTMLAIQQGATLYTIQLALNLIWMPLFFRFKRPIEATVDIIALTGLTGYLTYVWGQVDEVAGWCLVPYLGWLSFATYLSAGAGYLNNWDFASKEQPKSTKAGSTTYLDEKPKAS